MERTLVILKPDAVQRGLVGAILDRFERRGLQLVGMRLIQIDGPLAERHYGEHKGKGFYEGLVAYITSSPVVVAVLEGPNAVAVVRTTMGSTNPKDAAPGTIRGDFAVEIGRNLVHGSDSLDSAARELGLYFADEDLVAYRRAVQPWVTE